MHVNFVIRTNYTAKIVQYVYKNLIVVCFVDCTSIAYFYAHASKNRLSYDPPLLYNSSRSVYFCPLLLYIFFTLLAFNWIIPGFDTTSNVSIGGNGCDVTAATYSSITCVTSASATESTLAVSVITSGVAATGSVTYSYVTTGTGSINGIAPATVGIGGGEYCE